MNRDNFSAILKKTTQHRFIEDFIMICDSMRAFSRYAALAPEVWEKLSAFFAALTEDTEPGSYELAGPALRVNLVDAKLAPVESGKYEAHRQFIDIHIPLRGTETIICRNNSCDLKQIGSFDEAGDCVFFEAAPGMPVYLEPGYFLFLYPGEPHHVLTGDGEAISKVIIKIDIEYFNQTV